VGVTPSTSYLAISGLQKSFLSFLKTVATQSIADEEVSTCKAALLTVLPRVLYSMPADCTICAVPELVKHRRAWQSYSWYHCWCCLWLRLQEETHSCYRYDMCCHFSSTYPHDITSPLYSIYTSTTKLFMSHRACTVPDWVCRRLPCCSNTLLLLLPGVFRSLLNSVTCSDGCL
jgi:hypothetical protein